MNGKTPRAYERLLTWGYCKYGWTWAILHCTPQKGLAEKGKKGRGGKQSKRRCTIALIVADNGSMFDIIWSKLCDHIVIWISKKPCCFKNLTNI